MAMLHVTVQAFGSLMTGGDGVNGELGSREAVSAHEDVFLGGLISQLVGHGIDPPEELHLGVFQEVFEDHRLSDGEDHHVGFQRDQLFLVILRSKTMLIVIY